MSEENPPLLKRWRNLYALVIGTLVVIIICLYYFTEYFK